MIDLDNIISNGTGSDFKHICQGFSGNIRILLLDCVEYFALPQRKCQVFHFFIS